MKNKKNNKLVKRIIIFLALVLIFILGLNYIVLRMDEDSWIKNSKGIWIKHGNPSAIPSYVLEQQEAINCALGKFSSFTEEKSSQCIGVCGDYAVDIVHVPRTAEDNLAENQCQDYVSGAVSHFIELDKNGEIVRVV
jgi:hypothetical protein